MATGGTNLRMPVVHYIAKDFTFADAGTTITVGVVPIGGTVIRGGVVVSTAFNGDTTNTLDIGTAADTDGFATDLALGTIGVIVADEMATTNDAGPYTSDTTIQAVVVSTASASAGVGRVWVEYILDPDLHS